MTDDVESDPWEDDTESGTVLKQRTKIIPELGADVSQAKGAGVKSAKAEKNMGRKQPRMEQKPERRQPRAEQKPDSKQLGAELRADMKQPGTEPKADRKQPRAEQKPDRRIQTRVETRPEPRTALDEDFEVIDLEDL